MNAVAGRRQDPPQRLDGRCAVCEKTRKPPKQTGTNSLARKEWTLDPYCSTECCRADHGVTLNTQLGRPAHEEDE